MNGYWLKLLASFLFITVMPACWIAAEMRDAGNETEAVDGVVDLRSRNLQADGEIRLNGTWMLYPGRLIRSADTAEAVPSPDRQPVAVRVPGIWNHYADLDSGRGTATYRLRLLLPEGTDGIYGIRMTNIRTSSRIYVNGEEIGGSGRPGMSRGDTVPGNTPYAGYFRLQGAQAEIVVQAANYSYASGGIIYPVWFGTQEAIARGREFNLFEYWMTAGGFLIPALFLLLFFRLRRREAPLLQLGGFCLCGLMYVLTHGEKAALSLLPAFNYEWVLRTQLISSGFIYYFLARHVVQLFPKFGVRLLDWLVLGIAAALAVAGLVLPTYQFSRWETLLLFCSLFSIAYVMFVLVRAILTRGEHTVILAASMQSVLIMLAVYLLYGFGKLEDQTLLPYAIIVFSASQAYLIVARFSNLLGHAERMSERLLRLDEQKDEFMLNTSYEIREPLHAITNLAAMQEKGQAADGRESEQRLAMIESMARRLSYLVEDIIDFSLLQSGEAEYRHRTVYLQPIVRSVLELYPSREPFGWTLEPMPENLPPLLADERRLGQIVYNLVAYASNRVRVGVVRLWAQADNGRVTLAIAAPGIAKALETDADELEFYPADETGAESAERVRLSVTRRLIELGGGTWRTFGPADGAETLYVSWPTALAEAAAAMTDAASEREAESSATVIAGDKDAAVEEADRFRRQVAAALERPRRANAVPTSSDVAVEQAAGGSILIVVGDLFAARVLAHLLSDDRRSIRIASGGGAEALGLLTGAHAFDLVIIDLVMPDMSGMELVRRIRKRTMLAELPILLLCEDRLPGEALTGFRAGANDILVKPYDAAELQARIGTLLQLRSSIKSLVRTETAFLQAQIKPHFLFNALSTIMTVCRLDPSRAEELLLELSRYLRASFDFDHLAQRVPLRNELELVRAYLAIETARFGNRLLAEFDIDCDDRMLVPPLSLQPLVENAVRHGILRKPGGGKVRISIKSAGSGWMASVEDDGVGMPAGKLAEIREMRDIGSSVGSGGVGLANISRRLRLMYGEDLHIESRPGEGTRVGFKLPGSVGHEGDTD